MLRMGHLYGPGTHLCLRRLLHRAGQSSGSAAGRRGKISILVHPRGGRRDGDAGRLGSAARSSISSTMPPTPIADWLPALRRWSVHSSRGACQRRSSDSPLADGGLHFDQVAWCGQRPSTRNPQLAAAVFVVAAGIPTRVRPTLPGRIRQRNGPGQRRLITFGHLSLIEHHVNANRFVSHTVWRRCHRQRHPARRSCGSRYRWSDRALADGLRSAAALISRACSASRRAIARQAGAGNTHISLRRSFVELVTVADDRQQGVVAADATLVPLQARAEALQGDGQHYGDRDTDSHALARFQGLHILVFGTADVDATIARLAAQGVAHSAVNRLTATGCNRSGLHAGLNRLRGDRQRARPVAGRQAGACRTGQPTQAPFDGESGPSERANRIDRIRAVCARR